MSTTTNLSTLKINYLTQAQYDTALANNQINENEIYLTPTEDMTTQEVQDFVDELDIGGSGTAVDLVIEEGTSGIWTYRKWSSGKYHAWYVGTINLLAGTSWCGGYYHKASSTLSPPSFSQSVTSMYGSANSGVLTIYCGHTASLETYWFNGSSSTASNLDVRLDLFGTWK